jgi:hypothetical protein
MVPFKTISLTTSQSATIGTTLSAKGIVYALAGDSSQWNSTFTTVRTNSASWEESADILPTVTNYLSTNNVLLSSATISNTLSISSVQIRTKGTSNVFIGNATTGRDAATGNHNFVFGLSAGNALTTGSNNVFIGNCTGRVNTTGGSNNFLGFEAGRNNTTGTYNNFLGSCAGFCNTTGTRNNFLGHYAGCNNRTGAYNNFLGAFAGSSNSTGCSNNFFGLRAGRANQTSCNNNFFGFHAGYGNSAGSSDNFLGYKAGYCNTTGSANNFLGFRAGYCNTTGSLNNFLGNRAGCSNTTGNNNTIIGNGANVSSNNFSGVIVLGTGAIATESHQVVLSTANVLFRSTGSTFEIGSPSLTDNLTVYGTISSTQAIFASGGNSNQWNSTYTTVQNNSASWEESAEILPTVTNYLSTSNVLISGLNVTRDIVANRIQATVKNFYIKHPTKPDKHLVYSSLESPYNGVQLTGEGEVANGLCIVELPDYLNNLVHSDSVHIQLTNYQHSKSLHVERINIDQNNFTVKCDSWFSKSQKLKFFWLLNGVRKDIERLETEV